MPRVPYAFLTRLKACHAHTGKCRACLMHSRSVSKPAFQSPRFKARKMFVWECGFFVSVLGGEMETPFFHDARRIGIRLYP